MEERRSHRKVENILNKIYKKKLLNAEEKLFLKCHDGLITLQLSDIIYIQTENKLLILHTIHGDVQSSQRMSELEKRLSKKQFFRCHNSYMVNFDYVEGVKKDSVLIKDKVQKLKTIPISKYKKEEFMRALFEKIKSSSLSLIYRYELKNELKGEINYESIGSKKYKKILWKGA